jgi:hypothetical protein
MAFLLVREPGRVAFIVALSDLCSIGRDPGNDLVLADSHVSRAHARIVACSAGREVRDLDSRHGTYVNGARIAAQTLQDGDQLQIGQVELTYRIADPSPRAVLASATAAGMPPPELAGVEARRLRLLHEVSRMVGAGGERSALAGKILERTIAGLGGEAGLVGLVEQPGRLRRLAGGNTALVLPPLVLEAVLRRRESILVADGGQHAMGSTAALRCRRAGPHLRDAQGADIHRRGSLVSRCHRAAHRRGAEPG